MMKALRIATVVAVLSMAVVACGDDGGGIEIDGQWARTSPKTATNGAAYMKITAPDADALIGASVDSSVAGRAEVHEMTMASDGAMMMQQTEAVPLPAGETVSLEPGGYHVMFIDLANPFEKGQKFEVTLQFENGEDMTIEVEVTEEAP
jgi:periplasmic copper chaperone A